MNETITKIWQAQGFTAQTEIQAKVYDALLQGESIQGLAPTGTGKTLAFSLPILENIKPGAGLQLLILVSSQELAHQMQQALQPFVAGLALKQTVVTGNANVQRQIERLKTKPEVIIATVGRLMELLNKNKVKGKHLQTVILDEADALLFENGQEKLQMVLDHLPKPLQLGFFGATTSSAVTDFAAHNRVALTTVDVRHHLVHTQNVEHLFLKTSPKGKAVILKELSRQKNFYGIAFFRQKNQLIKTDHILHDWHVNTALLDGRKDAQKRQVALQNFRKHKINLMLATDVAARGLDVEDLTMVINFDLPETKTEYIHRSGRTGRMHRKGRVLSLGNDHDRRLLQQQLGDSVVLKPVYLVDGHLTSERPKKAANTAEKGPKTGKAAAHRPTPPKKHHVKNKHIKQRKNKGKPKPKQR